ncbi:ankyrin repeat domain-containing protein 65-like [Nasonia vitripennis]|uniref:Uncharacterized protein n=1 Tax=Nasonia vitripennis TaxID=7425 RepID=A0A7M7HEV6_NASVI|nr:ankyrin repeat domain-containing protein 65-like [Nasonia vitripennis]
MTPKTAMRIAVLVLHACTTFIAAQHPDEEPSLEERRSDAQLQNRSLYKNASFSDGRQANCGDLEKARSELALIRHKHSAFTSAKVQELLCAAVRSGEDSLIRIVLEEGLDIIKQSPNHELLVCFLWIAVLCDLDNEVKVLLKTGANVNVLLRDHHMFFLEKELTILHALLRKDSSSSNEQLIELVKNYGANLQARDCDGQTALHYAAMTGRIREAKLFLKKGANSNAADNNGMTPLLAAAQSIKANELLPLLIMHGANVKARDVDGRNILHWLAYAPVEHAGLVRALIELGVSISERESVNQYQALHLAAANGKKQMVQILLEYGANPNTLAGDDVFPLYLAAARSDMSLALKTLLERGANIHLISITGETALHSDCKNVQVQDIAQLISSAANLLAEDQVGDTPFTLIRYKNVNPCSRLMMRRLALIKACSSCIKLKDESIMQEFPKMLSYYSECMQNIYKMVLTRLTASCTVFDLLTGDSWEIAQLMLDHKFQMSFRQFDLTEFSMYTEDVLEAFEWAEKCYHLILEQEDLISSEEECCDHPILLQEEMISSKRGYCAPYTQQKEIKYAKKSLLVKNV